MGQRQGVTVSTEPEQTEDDFQKELIDLFGQEAQEWLIQIHSALTELESQPGTDRHAQLVDAVVRGITSLGGSAATVNLPDVERTTFALLPFIDTLKDRTTTTKQDFGTVREQFSLVIASVTMATGITLDCGPALATPLQSEPAIEFLTLLNALRMLQDEQVAKGVPARSLIPQVMHRLEQEARQGDSQIQMTAFHHLLEELQNTDARCLESLRQALPPIAQHLGKFREEGLTVPDPGHMLGSCMQQIDQLQGIAKQVNATPLVTFLTGLQNFLALIVQRRLVIASQRLQAVETRILAVTTTIEDWIAAGQQERDLMSRLLPAA